MRILSAPISYAFQQLLLLSILKSEIINFIPTHLSRRKFLNRLRGTITYDVQIDQIPYWVLGQQKHENEPCCFCPDSQIHSNSLWGFEARTQTCEELEQYK